MKKILIPIWALLLLSGCQTYTSSGAILGAKFGSTIGSAIGGIQSGPYGSDVGTLIGMAGGAVLGAGIGSAIDNANRQRQQANDPQYQQQGLDQAYNQGYNQGYDQGYNQAYSQQQQQQAAARRQYPQAQTAAQGRDVILPQVVMPFQSELAKELKGYVYTSDLEIRNARLLDSDASGAIERGEECKVVFEVFNVGNEPVHNVWPTVSNASGTKNIFISPGVGVEMIAPGQGIRYTAAIKGGPRLGDGAVVICVAAVLPDAHCLSRVCQFTLPTAK